MKKFCFLLIAIVMVFSLFACDNMITPPKEYKFSDAMALVETAGEATFGDIEDFLTLGLGLNLDVNYSIGDAEINYGVDGDLKIKLDYDQKSNTILFGTIVSTGDEATNLFPELDHSFYYQYGYNQQTLQEESYIYLKSVNEENGEDVLIKKHAPLFADIFQADFDSFKEFIMGAMGEGMKELPLPAEGLPSSEDIDKDSLIALLDTAYFSEPEKLILAEVIDEQITENDLNPDNYFNAEETSSKVSFSLNYSKLKALLIKVIDAIQSKTNNILTKNSAKESFLQKEGVMEYYQKEIIEYILSYYDYTEIFNELFTGTDDSDFIDLCNISDYDWLSDAATYNSIEEAAEGFNFYEEYETYTEWFYNNKYDELYDYITGKDGEEDILYKLINEEFGEAPATMIMLKEILPTKFNLEYEIGLSNGKITSVSFDIDIEMKIPDFGGNNGDDYDDDSGEGILAPLAVQSEPTIAFQDVKLNVTFELTIETDPEDIVITPPDNLNDYILIEEEDDKVTE